MGVKYLLIMLLISFFSPKGFSQNISTTRKPYAAGRFYPDNPTELKVQLQQLFSKAEEKNSKNTPLAIIVPHAGYVFSGEVAASAYNQIDPNSQFEHIFIIGSSHTTQFQGASVYCTGDFETPLGMVKVDQELVQKLVLGNKLLKCYSEPHLNEHSLEVQLPFLQYHLKKPFKIVPIIIGSATAETAKKLAAILKPYFNEKNLFVISSDFSHYPRYENAIKVDLETAEIICENQVSKLIAALDDKERKKIPGLSTRLCGWSSVLTLLNMTEEIPDITVDLVQYKNSGDSRAEGRDGVVGYCAISFTLANQKSKANEFSICNEDKKYLLKLARETITQYISNETTPEVNDFHLSDTVKTASGAFVTLSNDHKLRGCIGRINPEEPLWKVVQAMAIAAATQDHRFNPVMSGEVDDLEIEISVLTPLKKIKSADEFEVGKQGIYIKKGNQTGTFLPQVADTTSWSKEEFLGHCAQDKAGIGWNGWKSAELYTYEVLVFKEEK